MKCGRWTWAAVLLAAALCSEVGAGGPPGRDAAPPLERDSGRTQKKPPQYIVVEVGTTAGEVRYEAILNGDLAARRKEYTDLYRESLAEWTKAKDAARKTKDKFTEKRPVTPYVKKVSEFFRTEDEARVEADRLRCLKEAKETPPAKAIEEKKALDGKKDDPPNP